MSNITSSGEVELLAPNCKKSNLTPEEWHLVRTPAFKKWFGDWENDAENASKVIDEETKEPLVVWHGTYGKEKLYIFDFAKADLGFHFGTNERAKVRSKTKIVITDFNSIVNPYFLNIRKLYLTTDIGVWEYPQRYISTFISEGLITEKEASQNGFLNICYRDDNKLARDFLLAKFGEIGFKYNSIFETKGLSYIALNPKQIKLANGEHII